MGSHSFTNTIRDFVAWHDGTQTYSVVAEGSRTILLNRTNSAFTELNAINQQCSRLELFNYDTDSAPEILCVESITAGYSNTLSSHVVVFEIDNHSLAEVQRTETPSVFDIAVDQSTQTEQSWFVTARQSGSIFDNDVVVQVVNYNNKGHKIWQSSKIEGQPGSHGMKTRLGPNGLEMLLSTEKAMYWAR